MLRNYPLYIHTCIPIHVYVLARAEVSPAEGAGLEEAAGHAVARRGGGGARPHHLLQYDVRRVRVPAMAVGVVMVVHQDLEPHNEALALARTPAVGTGGRADDADAVVGRGGATLLPEVEDALPSREHGHEEWGGEEGGGGITSSP